MSKLNNFFKAVVSWVDSHIIDYPTAIIFFRFLGNLTRITKITILVFFVSLCLLFFASVFFANLLLLVLSLYLLHKREYKFIFFVWVSFLFLWYLVFMACLIGYEGSILIAPNFFSEEDSESRQIFFFIIDKYASYYFTQNSIYFKLGHFCMETFGLLCWISLNIKVTIYIPSLFKGILFLLKLMGWRY